MDVEVFLNPQESKSLNYCGQCQWSLTEWQVVKMALAMMESPMFMVMLNEVEAEDY